MGFLMMQTSDDQYRRFAGKLAAGSIVRCLGQEERIGEVDELIGIHIGTHRLERPARVGRDDVGAVVVDRPQRIPGKHQSLQPGIVTLGDDDATGKRPGRQNGHDIGRSA